MGMEIRQLHPLFAGEVGGIDLARPLDAAAVGAIWEAIDQFAVLVFHDQRLSDDQLRDFARKFGDLEIGRSAAEGGKRRLALPEIGDISNLDEAGRVSARNIRRRGSGSCGAIPVPSAGRSIFRRSPRSSSAGRCPRAVYCFTI